MEPFNKAVLAAFTETQVVNTFEVSYLDVRIAKRRLGLSLESPVSYGCLQEISYLHDEESITSICNKYRCEPTEVQKARYRLPKKQAYTRPKAEEIVPWLATGLAETTIADALGCSVRYVRRMAKQHADMFPTRAHTRLSAEQEQALVAQLKQGCYTQEQIATAFGVSQSKISQLNPNKQTRAPYGKLTDKAWKEIKTALINKDAGVSELARRYNVSRGAIYQKIYSKGLY